MKKALILIAVVVAVHCAVITALFLVQGCKSTKGIKGEPVSTTPPLPPIAAPAATAPKAEPALPAGTTEETIEYTVKSGDSLGSIAKHHHISRAELIDLNKLADPNKIRIGQRLIIPKRGPAAAAPASKTHEPKPKTKKGESAPEPSLAKDINEYVVQAGDSLARVASKFKVKISELREVNKLVNDKLKVGQKLIIPGKKKTEGAAEPAPAPEAAPPKPATAGPAAPAKTEAPAAAPAAKTAGITHVVLPNEDLNSIAKLYVVALDDLAAANQLGTNRTVQPGQKIVIPQP